MASNGVINILPRRYQDENDRGGTICCLFEGDHGNNVGVQITALSNRYGRFLQSKKMDSRLLIA